MFRKTLVSSMLAAGLLLTPLLTRGTTVTSGDVNIVVTVDQFAEWATVPSIAAGDWGHINQVNQTRTVSKDLTLYANVAVTLAATTSAGNPDYNGQLSDSTNTYHLATQYMISGTGITGSGSLLDSSVFFTANTYALAHTAGQGAYTVTLTVTAASPATAAPEAGDYSCGLSLTATW